MIPAVVSRWSLQDAKARFSELVRRALASGPQLVMRGREEAVVVVSAQQYAKLSAPTQTLAELLRESPLAHVTLDVGRSRETGRAVDLSE